MRSSSVVTSQDRQTDRQREREEGEDFRGGSVSRFRKEAGSGRVMQRAIRSAADATFRSALAVVARRCVDSETDVVQWVSDIVTT